MSELILVQENNRFYISFRNNSHSIYYTLNTYLKCFSFPYVLEDNITLYTWSKSHWLLKCLFSNNKIKRDEWMNKRSKYYTSHVILPIARPPLVLFVVLYIFVTTNFYGHLLKLYNRNKKIKRGALLLFYYIVFCCMLMISHLWVPHKINQLVSDSFKGKKIQMNLCTIY